jgi:tRNA (guanine37-N1)-methyltransferase
MRIDVISLFPDMFSAPLATSIVGRARKSGVATVEAHDLRRWADDDRGTVDDAPFGGGGGMVLMAQPLASAVTDLRGSDSVAKVIYLAPDGETLTQDIANELALETHLVLVAGHYRGVDQRFRDQYVDREISIGDYVLSGGELPALVLIDALIRLLPGAIGNFESALEDSFQNGMLDCPWYTRPRTFEGHDVPTVLLDGDRAAIRSWRSKQSEERTIRRRPDILGEK